MFVTAALVLALAGASPAPASPAPAASAMPSPMASAAMPSFTMQQTKIAVKAGAPFQIRLAVSSGTGYSWRSRGPLAPGLTLVGDFQTPRGKRMPGGPGQQVLVFRAADVGSYKLTLEYTRPWLRAAKPAKMQTFTITVHK